MLPIPSHEKKKIKKNNYPTSKKKRTTYTLNVFFHFNGCWHYSFSLKPEKLHIITQMDLRRIQQKCQITHNIWFNFFKIAKINDKNLNFHLNYWAIKHAFLCRINTYISVRYLTSCTDDRNRLRTLKLGLLIVDQLCWSKISLGQCLKRYNKPMLILHYSSPSSPASQASPVGRRGRRQDTTE